eukprot:3736489-Alexandrium_andersonii.AAC.1
MAPDGGCPDSARATARPPDPTQGLPLRGVGGSPEGGVPSAQPAIHGYEGAPSLALVGSAGARPEGAGFGDGLQLPDGCSDMVNEACVPGHGGGDPPAP